MPRQLSQSAQSTEYVCAGVWLYIRHMEDRVTSRNEGKGNTRP